MESKEVWNLTRIFFRYMSPIKYIILYNPKTRNISLNSKNRRWFYSQASFTILVAIIWVYFLLNPNLESIQNSKSMRKGAFMLGILYAGIIGLYAIFTFSVGCRGDTFYCCFNTLIRLQHKLQSK